MIMSDVAQRCCKTGFILQSSIKEECWIYATLTTLVMDNGDSCGMQGGNVVHRLELRRR